MATSTDFELLATSANYIKNDLIKSNSAWIGSPFDWVMGLAPGTKGKLGKLLAYQWCALKGLSVGSSPDSEADMTVNGHRVEVKFSTIWQEGSYRFQQIRNQNYEYSICLGISPQTANCWVISKKILMEFVIGHLGQHTGAKGTETAWFLVYPDNPPPWLIGCGGTLEQAYAVLRSLSKK